VELGSVGIWSIGLRGRDAQSAAAAAELEELGYGTLWFPAGAPHGFEIARSLLAATTSVIVATGILSIWTQPPAEVVEGFGSLEQFAPGRFLLGLGVSHGPFVDRNAPGTYQRPLETMRDYLDALDAVPVDRRMLAALGPKMLELAATRTLGTHPYLVTAEHTARLRLALGSGPLLATEQAVVVETDPATARAIGRAHLAGYLSLPNYVNNWLRIGFNETDILEGGSDRLVDALVAWGSPEQIAGRVREHHQAGADHVCIQVLFDGDRDQLPLPQWRELAPALGL
jgi:probable F420-dependent oxidoreductase